MALRAAPCAEMHGEMRMRAPHRDTLARRASPQRTLDEQVRALLQAEIAEGDDGSGGMHGVGYFAFICASHSWRYPKRSTARSRRA
jgi:hypothetical protein